MGQAKTAIDQQTQKRRETGLIAYDPTSVYNGYTLFTTLSGDGTVYLIDLQGKVVHQWQLPYPPYYGYLLENGNLFYNGWTPAERDDLRFPHWPLYKAGVILEANWQGEILWEYKHPDHHHDARRTRAGTIILLTIEKTPEHIARQIQGQIAQSGIWSDRIIEVTLSGEVLWEWHAWEHLDELIDRPVHAPEDPHHWPHGNGIEELPNGDILVSFRGISTVVIISKKTGAIVWQLGHDVLAQQHNPTSLENGNILIFDNGTQRVSDPHTYSRVIEVNPQTNDIVWEYRDTPAYNFYSAFISGAQRLANGNTLITEGLSGRIFEVTPKGEVIWEYINPYFSELLNANKDQAIPPDVYSYYGGAKMNSIFRAFRYAPERFPQLNQELARG